LKILFKILFIIEKTVLPLKKNRTSTEKKRSTTEKNRSTTEIPLKQKNTEKFFLLKNKIKLSIIKVKYYLLICLLLFFFVVVGLPLNYSLFWYERVLLESKKIANV
jgi:hypothetical protein